MQFFFQTLEKITSLMCRPLLMTNPWSRSRKLSMALRVIAGGMAATSCRIASFNCSIVPGWRRPGTVEQLKEAIRQEVAAIPHAMTRKAMDNFRERLQECVINNGRHLSDVIFKSIWKKNASYVLFINKRFSCVPCFIWFLLTFKMRELFLPHPV